MTVNTQAFFLQNPVAESGTGGPASFNSMYPETPPAILWGQGTPDGDRAPFNLVNKGSLYLSTDQTDDTGGVIWVKVDEGGDNADWVRLVADNKVVVLPTLINISDGDSDNPIFHAVTALTITEIGILWVEATPASGSLEGDVAIGIASSGEEVVAPVAYPQSSAAGSYQALTIVDGQMDAGETLWLEHDIAASSAGTYYIVLKYNLNS